MALAEPWTASGGRRYIPENLRRVDVCTYRYRQVEPAYPVTTRASVRLVSVALGYQNTLLHPLQSREETFLTSDDLCTHLHPLSGVL
jgi:hypothetical protein